MNENYIIIKILRPAFKDVNIYITLRIYSHFTYFFHEQSPHFHHYPNL